MRALAPICLLALGVLVAGVLLTRTSGPAPATAPAPALVDDEALAALRKDNALLRSQISALAGEVAALRADLQSRPNTVAAPAVIPVPADPAETAAAKPAREALDRYRAANGNQRPANPADLVPYFTDPEQAAAYLRKQDPANGAKAERQQLKTELKAELKQRTQAGAAVPPP